MQKSSVALTALVFLAVGIYAAFGQAPAQPRGVLSVLQVGQQVIVKETTDRFEIRVFEKGPGLLGHKVIEIGNDYLVVRT